MTSSSPSAVVFLLLCLIHVVASFDGIDIRRHSPPPWFGRYDEDTEDFRQTLKKPWIAVDREQLILTLANTTGFRIASAILQKLNFAPLLPVNLIYTGPNHPWDKMYISNCDGITIYITCLENEVEILQNDPGIVDEIRSGERRVLNEFVMKVKLFDVGVNVSVLRPFIYSDEDGAVVAHGVEGYEATEIQIKNMRLYPPQDFSPEYPFRPMLAVFGEDGFEYYEFPLLENEEDFIRESKMKIEMAITASLVPTPQEFDNRRQYMPHKDSICETLLLRKKNWSGEH